MSPFHTLPLSSSSAQTLLASPPPTPPPSPLRLPPPPVLPRPAAVPVLPRPAFPPYPPLRLPPRPPPAHRRHRSCSSGLPALLPSPPRPRSLITHFQLSRKIAMDVQRAESPHQNLMAGDTVLDPRRADAASKHVRALNTQFASWVQSQLQNHPAELWEDGMKDYLSHASEIMENFKDVVNWLREKKAGTTAVSSPSPANDEKTTSPATVSSKFMVQPGSDNGQKSLTTGASSLAFQNSSSPNMFSFSSQKKTTATSGIFDNKDTPGDSSKPTFQFGGINGFSTPTTPSIFSSPISQSFSMPTPTLFSVNQQPIFTGSGNKNAAEASGDADEDAEAEQPSSPSVKKAEEKGIVVVHEAKCKVYVKHDDPTKGWKDIGVGQLSIRCKEGAEKASKESTPTVVIRNDVGKILLNAMIYKGIKMNVQKNTVASIFHTSDAQSESDGGNVVARTYLLRLRNEEAAINLSAVIKENTPLD